MENPRHIPLATYRLQFNREFTFQQATELAGYLRDLGISDCYASPLFKAGLQSTHGYDICAFDQLNPNLGTTADFARLTARLRDLGLGLLVDMVPNHMSADPSNDWWADVLEHGSASAYASWFDIDWHPWQAELQNKVLLPILEDHYARVLHARKLQLVFHDGFAVAYYDRRFPLSACSYGEIIGRLAAVCATDQDTAAMLQDCQTRLKQLSELEPAARRSEFFHLKGQLARLHETSTELRTAVAAIFEELNGRDGQPHSFDALHRLLELQHYRLAYWRAAGDEINYRRFFDVTELVSMRMELPEVFEATHELLFRMLQAGQITGVRVDHPDGLWNPKQYFNRLQERAIRSTQYATLTTPLYIVVEKILTPDEPLPADWPIAGTTGYDFLNRLNGLFVNQDNGAAMDSVYRELTGQNQDFAEVVYASKQRILDSSLRSEHNSLVHRLNGIASRTRFGQDLSLTQLDAGLKGIIAAFPVYRCYINEERTHASAWEEQCVTQAVSAAKTQNTDLDPAALELIENLLLLRFPEDLADAEGKRCREWVMRFQQLTGPVMAKGLEDTAFYNFNRLSSLNEVGGDPGSFGTGLEAFHAHNSAKAREWPHSMLATATHDTKRGEDARARINVLSEMPDEWRDAVRRWSRLNAAKKPPLGRSLAPHSNDEYLLYQTLVGAWPPEADSPDGLARFRERISTYMLKAIREAKTRTSWTDPNAAYEAATRHFVQSLLADSEPNPFLDDFKPFQRRIAFFGRFNSLSQALLKMAAPGVPDFYQGTELWDLNLVDPDNRRPVDYGMRRSLLAETKAAVVHAPKEISTFLRRLAEESHTGQIKLYLTWRALNFRRSHRQLFDNATYVPLGAIGPKAGHLCSFARVSDDGKIIAIAPRFVFGLTNGLEQSPLGQATWEDTSIVVPDSKPGEQYANVLTDEILSVGQPGRIPVAEALASFPVALLKKQ